MLPEIETARLRLRAFAHEDLEAFAALRADAGVMRYIGLGGVYGPQTREQAAGWLERNERRWREHGLGMWAVVEKENDGGLLGWCGLGRLEDTETIEVGYGLAPRAWGRGLATEAARASLRFAFEELALPRVVAVANPDNAASRRVMEKLGMTYVRLAHHYGASLAFYEILRENFRPDASPYVLHRSTNN